MLNSEHSIKRLPQRPCKQQAPQTFIQLILFTFIQLILFTFIQLILFTFIKLILFTFIQLILFTFIQLILFWLGIDFNSTPTTHFTQTAVTILSSLKSLL